MKKFTSIADVDKVQEWVKLACELKQAPFAYQQYGKNKTLGLVFLNPSLRTRLSAQRAAYNLGMNVMVMNMGQDGWAIEWQDGTVMDQGSQEHIREAAAVISQYCDVIGIRTFPSLINQEEDYAETILNQFLRFAQVPVISLESATLHPLQSFADLITIEEHKTKSRPKVVLTWAPHPKALPQAVANSFIQWMQQADVELVVTNPEGYELAPKFTQGITPIYDQEEALKGADFVYAKNWSAYNDYGATLPGLDHWQVTGTKMALTDQAKFMHCLPVRRNVVVADEVLGSPDSLVIAQANNRIWSAQTALLKLLSDES